MNNKEKCTHFSYIFHYKALKQHHKLYYDFATQMSYNDDQRSPTFLYINIYSIFFTLDSEKYSFFFTLSTVPIKISYSKQELSMFCFDYSIP